MNRNKMTSNNKCKLFMYSNDILTISQRKSSQVNDIDIFLLNFGLKVNQIPKSITPNTREL